jgi:hypothetical protein
VAFEVGFGDLSYFNRVPDPTADPDPQRISLLSLLS